MAGPVRVPEYPARPHASGQARIRLGGQDVYLGPFHSPESYEKYRREVANFLVAGFRPSPRKSAGLSPVIDAWVRHATSYYTKRGRQTGAHLICERVARDLKGLYGSSDPGGFGPLDFQAVRQAWIKRGNARTTVNLYAGFLKTFFIWASASGLIDPKVAEAVRIVPGLRKGRGVAPERPRVRPADPEDVEATAACLAPVLAAMVRLQAVTGMRPTEVCWLRRCDLDTSGAIWRYTVAPEANKTDHYTAEDSPRRVAIGPQGQAVLQPWLAEAGSPSWSILRPALALDPRPVRNTARFTPASYRNRVLAGCRRAGVEPWSPNRLRHLYLTRVRAALSLDHARAAAGHYSADTTTIYAEEDFGKAAHAAGLVG